MDQAYTYTLVAIIVFFTASILIALSVILLLRHLVTKKSKDFVEVVDTSSDDTLKHWKSSRQQHDDD